jgi:hypothetical protein
MAMSGLREFIPATSCHGTSGSEASTAGSIA